MAKGNLVDYSWPSFFFFSLKGKGDKVVKAVSVVFDTEATE